MPQSEGNTNFADFTEVVKKCKIVFSDGTYKIKDLNEEKLKFISGLINYLYEKKRRTCPTFLHSLCNLYMGMVVDYFATIRFEQTQVRSNAKKVCEEFFKEWDSLLPTLEIFTDLNISPFKGLYVLETLIPNIEAFQAGQVNEKPKGNDKDDANEFRNFVAGEAQEFLRGLINLEKKDPPKNKIKVGEGEENPFHADPAPDILYQIFQNESAAEERKKFFDPDLWEMMGGENNSYSRGKVVVSLTPEDYVTSQENEIKPTAFSQAWDASEVGKGVLLFWKRMNEFKIKNEKSLTQLSFTEDSKNPFGIIKNSFQGTALVKNYLTGFKERFGTEPCLKVTAENFTQFCTFSNKQVLTGWQINVTFAKGQTATVAKFKEETPINLTDYFAILYFKGEVKKLTFDDAGVNPNDEMPGSLSFNLLKKEERGKIDKLQRVEFAIKTGGQIKYFMANVPKDKHGSEAIQEIGAGDLKILKDEKEKADAIVNKGEEK